MSILIRPSDRSWVDSFEQERDALQPLLAAWLATPVQHIGSTAVPGLAAKPIIDMMAGVGDLDAARSAAEPLTECGYVHAEHRPDALYFHRELGPERLGYHFHLTEPGSPLWRERLAFRDALLADPGLAEQYLNLKVELARRYPDDLRAYTDGKRTFVVGVLASVGIKLQPR